MFQPQPVLAGSSIEPSGNKQKICSLAKLEPTTPFLVHLQLLELAGGVLEQLS